MKVRMLFLIIVLLILQNSIRKFLLLNITVFSFIDELIVLCCVPLFLNNIKVIYRQTIGKFFFFSFSFFILLGIISGVFYNANPLAVILQLLLNFKWVIITIAFSHQTALLHKDKNRFINFLKIVIISSLLLGFLKIFFDKFYSQIFDGEDFEEKIDLYFFHIYRATGIFWHSSQLATFSVVAFIFFYLLQKDLLFSFLSFLLLLISVQRQEILAFISLIPLIPFIQKLKLKKQLKVYVSLFTLFPLVILSIILILIDSGYILNFIDETIDPRIIFAVFGVDIANNAFPLGSGFGTYAGHAAEVFKSPLYDKYVFDTFWWYKEGFYLTDTFWPNIFTEAGYIGLIFYYLSFVALSYYLIKKCNDRALPFFIAVFYLLLVSITSPNMNDAFSLFLIVLIYLFCSQKPITLIPKVRAAT